MNQKFPKAEKLKSSKTIEYLFLNGKKHINYPLKVIYKENTESVNHKIAFSVPKRNFKKAVERNRIKRLLREVYRLNKHRLIRKEENLLILFIYLGKQIPDYHLLEKKMISLLSYLSEKNIKN